MHRAIIVSLFLGPGSKKAIQHLFVKGSKYFEEILLSERATASKAAKVPEGEVGI